MNYVKKYPLFFILLALLMLAFVGGLAYNVTLFNKLGEQEKKFKTTLSKFKSSLNADPSEASVEKSLANIEVVKGDLDKLVKNLSPASDNIIKPTPVTEGYQFVEHLRGMVNSWIMQAKAKGIYLGENENFSYKKYYAINSDPPPDEAVPELWKQASILGHILSKLYASKPDNIDMRIDLVQRELTNVEQAKEAAARKTTRTRVAPNRRAGTALLGDNFVIDDVTSAKVEGSIDTFGYKIVFTSHTEVLRNFLNRLNEFDVMLVVRSIEVKEGAAIGEYTEAPPVDEFNSEGLTPEEIAAKTAREPVVSDNYSEFTVIIEYVEMAKENDSKSSEEDSDDSEKTSTSSK